MLLIKRSRQTLNPRKGTETVRDIRLVRLLPASRQTLNPRKGTETINFILKVASKRRRQTLNPRKGTETTPYHQQNDTADVARL